MDQKDNNISNKRLMLEIDELLCDVNDFMWITYGRPVWVMNKLRFSPDVICKDDLDQMKVIIDKIPNVDQLTKCRLLVTEQLPTSPENKERTIMLDRAIVNIKKCKNYMSQLILELQKQCALKQQKQTQLSNGKVNSNKSVDECTPKIDRCPMVSNETNAVDISKSKSKNTANSHCKCSIDGKDTVCLSTECELKKPKVNLQKDMVPQAVAKVQGDLL